MTRAGAFYIRVLGITPGYKSEHWTSFILGGVQIGLHRVTEGIEPGGGVVPCYRTKNLAEITARVQSEGGWVSASDHTTPRGSLRDFRDTEGNPFQFIQLHED